MRVVLAVRLAAAGACSAEEAAGACSAEEAAGACSAEAGARACSAAVNPSAAGSVAASLLLVPPGLTVCNPGEFKLAARHPVDTLRDVLLTVKEPQLDGRALAVRTWGCRPTLAMACRHVEPAHLE